MSKIFAVSIALLLAGPGAAKTDPEALWQSMESSLLEPEKAVTVKNLHLDAGLARLEIEKGTFFPATPVGARVAEMVFLGEARLVLEPPDDIEADQLDLFTGTPRLDEAVSEAVLVMAVDAAVDAVFRHPVTGADADAETRAAELFRRWRERPERRRLGVDTAILRDAVGDPLYAGYFAGWFRGEDLGEFLYFFEPGAEEQVNLGSSPRSAPPRRRNVDSRAGSIALSAKGASAVSRWKISASGTPGSRRRCATPRAERCPETSTSSRSTTRSIFRSKARSFCCAARPGFICAPSSGATR